MLKALLTALFNALLSFLFGKSAGKKDGQVEASKDAVEGYRKGEKIDAQPDLPNSGDNSIYKWFDSLRTPKK